MDEPAQPWRLERFADRLRLWSDQEKPPVPILQRVQRWVLSLAEDPYRPEARRERGEDDFWFAVIPAAEYGGLVVVCSYWIDAEANVVRCDLFGSLAYPA